jgi:hypothetical protein
LCFERCHGTEDENAIGLHQAPTVDVARETAGCEDYCDYVLQNPAWYQVNRPNDIQECIDAGCNPPELQSTDENAIGLQQRPEVESSDPHYYNGCVDRCYSVFQHQQNKIQYCIDVNYIQEVQTTGALSQMPKVEVANHAQAEDPTVVLDCLYFCGQNYSCYKRCVGTEDENPIGVHQKLKAEVASTFFLMMMMRGTLVRIVRSTVIRSLSKIQSGINNASMSSAALLEYSHHLLILTVMPSLRGHPDAWHQSNTWKNRYEIGDQTLRRKLICRQIKFCNISLQICCIIKQP